jgi:hypothetical protein
MKCVVCGAELPEGSAFCDTCGASQAAPAAETVPFAPVSAPVYAPPPPAVAAPVAAPAAAPVYAPPPAAASSSKGPVIALVVFGAVLAIGALVALAVFVVLPRMSAKPAASTAAPSGSTANVPSGSSGSSSGKSFKPNPAPPGGASDAPDPTAVAGEIFSREYAMDAEIAAAAAKVNAAIGKSRPQTPTLQGELEALTAAAEKLQTDAAACTDERAPMLAEAAGYMIVRAAALRDGYMAWYGGGSYQSYFQSGHDAKYQGLGYDQSGQPIVGGLQQRINAAFAG